MMDSKMLVERMKWDPCGNDGFEDVGWEDVENIHEVDGYMW